MKVPFLQVLPSPTSSSSSSLVVVAATFIYLHILVSSSSFISIPFTNAQRENIPFKMTAKTTTTTTTPPTSTPTTSTATTKTVYLIRHAESEENRRLGSLKSSVKGLCRLKIPRKEDVVASMELLNVSAQIDSDVSPKGQQQIEQLGKRIAKDDFVRNMGIELVAHSPLKRARQTSFGMLQCATPVETGFDANSDSAGVDNNDNSSNIYNININNDPSAKGAKHPSVKRVIELELLEERTPKEWLPTHFSTYANRIQQFELWLSEQPESVVAIVGHSQYFRSMLGLKSKFHNVDVWSLEFDPEEIRRRRNTNTSCDIDNDIGSGDGDSDGQKGVSNGRINSNKGNEEDEDRATDGGVGIVTELDGKPLGEIDLPPGWNKLKHHYRYDSKYTE